MNLWDSRLKRNEKNPNVSFSLDFSLDYPFDLFFLSIVKNKTAFLCPFDGLKYLPRMVSFYCSHFYCSHFYIMSRLTKKWGLNCILMLFSHGVLLLWNFLFHRNNDCRFPQNGRLPLIRSPLSFDEFQYGQ